MTKHLNTKSCRSISSLSELITKVTIHKCQICDALVLCDFTVISNHFRKHKMTVGQYKVRIKMLLKDGACLKEAYQQDIKIMIKDIPVVCTMQSNVMESNSLSNDQVTRNVGNISFFKCSFCSETGFSLVSLTWHKKKKHNMKTASFKMTEIIQASYHKCCVCDKIILCDNTVIGNHVSNSHKFRFSQYVREHVIKNGHIAIPTFREYKKSFERNFVEVQQAKDEDHNYDKGLIVPSMLSSESEDSDES